MLRQILFKLLPTLEPLLVVFLHGFDLGPLELHQLFRVFLLPQVHDVIEVVDVDKDQEDKRGNGQLHDSVLTVDPSRHNHEDNAKEFDH